MKPSKSVRTSIVVLASLGLLLQPLQSARAAGPSEATQGSFATWSNTAAVRDVELGRGGQLRGQIVDQQQAPISGVAVIARQSGHEVAWAASDADGHYEVRGLRGGVYWVGSADAGCICRLWASGTAPPAATRELLIISGGVVARGQRPMSDLFRDPYIILGLVIAAAIAIPIAVFDRESGS